MNMEDVYDWFTDKIKILKQKNHSLCRNALYEAKELMEC